MQTASNKDSHMPCCALVLGKVRNGILSCCIRHVAQANKIVSKDKHGDCWAK